jgi:hypothetical protein
LIYVFKQANFIWKFNFDENRETLKNCCHSKFNNNKIIINLFKIKLKEKESYNKSWVNIWKVMIYIKLFFLKGKVLVKTVTVQKNNNSNKNNINLFQKKNKKINFKR